MKGVYQPRSQSRFWAFFARRAIYAAQFPQIARQKADDENSLLERPGLQNEGFAHMSGHIGCEMRKFKGIMRPFAQN